MDQFTDSDFPADDTSNKWEGYEELKGYEIPKFLKWKRPSEIENNPSLFGEYGIRP